MSFAVTPQAYGRFMGRFSEPLADAFVDLAGVAPGQQALDVGCGPGVLTSRLVDRLGADAVTAVDPQPDFVAATRECCPGADVRVATAEALPFADRSVDAALAQLVVHFMADPVAGLAEMGRVARPDGTVAACVWDHAGGAGPLAAFWATAQELDPDAPGEADLPGTRAGHLGELAAAAGLRVVTETALTVSVPMASFDAWWEPFLLGVGPAGAYVAGLPDRSRTALRNRLAAGLPPGRFDVSATAWAVVAIP